MMPNRQPFSTLTPENMELFRENTYDNIYLNFLNPSFQYPSSHDSNIPGFQYSNWGDVHIRDRQSEPLIGSGRFFY
jgi:hypothetical protein